MSGKLKVTLDKNMSYDEGRAWLVALIEKFGTTTADEVIKSMYERPISLKESPPDAMPPSTRDRSGTAAEQIRRVEENYYHNLGPDEGEDTPLHQDECRSMRSAYCPDCRVTHLPGDHDYDGAGHYIG